MLCKLLAIPPRAAWHYRALDDVDRSYPPHDILVETSQGIALLRWLLHSVLPFPTFLLDYRYLAARLSIEPSSLRRILFSKQGAQVRKVLHRYEYSGLLASFSGPRWWRAGIEHWIWNETKGDPFSKPALQTLARAKMARALKPSQIEKPVISLDDQFRPTDDLIELSSAVQIGPDGWPPFADAAWVSLDAAKSNSTLAALVTPPDRARLF